MNNMSAFMKSLIFHAVIIALASVGILFKRDIVQVAEQPIEVSFVTPDAIPDKGDKKPEPIEETPPPIDDKPQPAPKALEQPKPKPKEVEQAEKPKEKPPAPEPEPEPEPKVAEAKPDPKPVPPKNPDKPKPKPKEKEPDKPEPEKPAEKDTSTDFMSVLKNLHDNEPADTGRDGPTLTESPTTDRMTTGELDAFRQQLSRCWSILPGAAQAEALAVNLTITVNRDRTVRNVQITDRTRYNSDPFFRAAADNAIRAIKHPDCTPLDLPPDKYDTWNAITLNFDPRTMF